ncbi:hypothetical protein FPZ12_009410 [Amycolatopsis acidicola]|uniref:Uncharacterized protein n=1 Tax=Amycolatopsis acidicola TaxID=2596893 RepID=A0A5N0VCY7_9PSEU|nr:hypothetical protein [Amycolatopsis acidicola]KAA9163213.1 hypothetical protein FPZ12_009410 [Amycolatopsis acidicola]
MAFVGFGVFRDRRKTAHELRRDFDSGREKLRTRKRGVRELSEWLPDHITAIKTPRAGSYGVKHAVEQALGRYVSNGELIVAAIMAGYRIGRPHGPNVGIGMSKRDLDHLRSRPHRPAGSTQRASG